MTIKKKSRPVSRTAELVVQELDGEVLIYDLRSDKAFCLNSTSAAIWKLCDGSRSVADIANLISIESKAANGEDLVWLALDQLKKEQLIDAGLDGDYDHFDGLSRRQVIKKIGLASAVAIPVVSSLIAPASIHAASICAGINGHNCECPFPGCPQTTMPAGSTCNGNNVPGSPSGDCNPLAQGVPSACVCRGPFTCISGNTVRGHCA